MSEENKEEPKKELSEKEQERLNKIIDQHKNEQID